MYTYMNEDVGECMCVGHNSERGMDLRLPLGARYIILYASAISTSEGRGRHLELFISKLADAVYCHCP